MMVPSVKQKWSKNDVGDNDCNYRLFVGVARMRVRVEGLRFETFAFKNTKKNTEERSDNEARGLLS